MDPEERELQINLAKYSSQFQTYSNGMYSLLAVLIALFGIGISLKDTVWVWIIVAEILLAFVCFILCIILHNKAKSNLENLKTPHVKHTSSLLEQEAGKQLMTYVRKNELCVDCCKRDVCSFYRVSLRDSIFICRFYKQNVEQQPKEGT